MWNQSQNSPNIDTIRFFFNPSNKPKHEYDRLKIFLESFSHFKIQNDFEILIQKKTINFDTIMNLELNFNYFLYLISLKIYIPKYVP